MPRMDALDLLYLRHRASLDGLRCFEAHAVSAVTGEGVPELASAIVDAAGGEYGRHDGRNVVVCGAASVGKSTLINVLAKQVSAVAARSLPQRTRFEEALAQARERGEGPHSSDRSGGGSGGGGSGGGGGGSGLGGLGMDGGRAEREGLVRELHHLNESVAAFLIRPHPSSFP